MCGIAGLFIKSPEFVKSHDALEKFLDTLMLGVSDRGKQASGFVAVTFEGKVIMDKDAVHASRFIHDREPLPKNTKYVLAHTRYSTKGTIENYLNNHPVLSGSCFVTHNGSIRNDDELFEKYKLKRTAEVDTEIIAALLSHSKFETPHKMIDYLSELDGSMAMAAIDVKQAPNTVVFAKTHTSPLFFHDNKKFFIWASEKKALKDAWGTVFGTPPADSAFKELKFREMLVLTDEGVTKYDIPSKYVNTTYVRNPSGVTRSGGTGPSQAATKTIAHGWVADLNEVRRNVDKMRREGKGIAREIPLVSRVLVGSIGGTCCVCTLQFMLDDLVQTSQGQMCLDCSKARREVFLAQEEAKKPVETLVFPYTQSQRENFNIWSQDDDYIHTLVITDLARESGLEVEAVEHILFRMTKAQAMKIPGMFAYQERLSATYDADYVQQWEDLEKGGLDGAYKALKAKAYVPPQEQLALPKPQQIRHFSLLTGTEETVRRYCNCCKAKPKTFIVRTSTKEIVGFCKQHWTKCHTSRCRKKPVFITAGGHCYCHEHSRNMSPGRTFTDLQKEGYTIGIGVRDALVGT